MPSRSEKRAALTKLGLVTLIAFLLAVGVVSSAHAATANVASFDAYQYTPPFGPTVIRADFVYTATWSGTNRECWRTID